MDLSEQTRKKILTAAREIFIEKGKSGARMQEIADSAGVNKALLHYHYSTKDILYEASLGEFLKKLFPRLLEVVQDTQSPRESIIKIISIYFDFVSSNPEFRKLVVQELAAGAEVFRKIISTEFMKPDNVFPSHLVRLFEEGIRRGEIRRVEPKQTIVNIVSMILFYFLVHPIADCVLNLEDQATREAFITKRQASIVDLLENGLFKKSE